MNFCLLPFDTSQEPDGNCSEKPVGCFVSGGFSSSYSRGGWGRTLLRPKVAAVLSASENPNANYGQEKDNKQNFSWANWPV